MPAGHAVLPVSVTATGASASTTAGPAGAAALGALTAPSFVVVGAGFEHASRSKQGMAERLKG